MTVASRRLRILIVEDEAMIRMMLVDMLEDIGHDVAAEAATLDEARRCAQEVDFDVAILDVNLGGEQIFPVVDIIGKRKLPFLLSTGYGASGLPEAYRNAPVLQKPFEFDRLREAIAGLTVRKV
jgi:DNA-binding NtrC family response regulator